MLIPNPVYKFVSTLSDVVILYTVLGSCERLPLIVSFLFKVKMSPCLTDSTILRNVGTSFSYSLIGYLSIIEGLKKLEINEIQMKKELEENYMVIAEGIQTRMKVLGINNSYEKLKEITRINDNKDTRTKLKDFINECHYFDDSEKDNLNKLTPFNYTGKYDY